MKFYLGSVATSLEQVQCKLDSVICEKFNLV